MLPETVAMDRILRPKFLCKEGSSNEMEGFPLFTQKIFNPKGRCMVCSGYFTEDCVRRLFDMEGNVTRLQVGSSSTSN